MLGWFQKLMPREDNFFEMYTRHVATVTAGAVIVDARGRVLLLQHHFRPGSGWGIPGGFMQPGEQPETALRRELREELGVEIEQVELAFARALERYQQIELIFRCTVQGEMQLRQLEIAHAAWFALDKLPEGLSADQRQLIHRALQGVAL